MTASSWTPPERSIAEQAPRTKRKPHGIVALRRRIENHPIRVPPVDWDAIMGGSKPLFRCYALGTRGRERPVVPLDLPKPCPVLAFTERGARHDILATQVMILEAHRMEPLGAISPEDLEAEGFRFLGAFRWYWKQRHINLGWRPWDLINVVSLRPPVPSDWDWCGEYLMNDLFGEWL